MSILILPLIGCPRSPPGSPRIVTAKTLVNDYAADRAAAKLAYQGQTLQVSLSVYTVSGSEIHYHVFIDGKPRRPALVFKFDKPPDKLPKGTLWIEGHCEGAVDDDEDRVLPGYKFTVILTRCRLVPPPVPSGQ